MRFGSPCACIPNRLPRLPVALPPGYEGPHLEHRLPRQDGFPAATCCHVPVMAVLTLGRPYFISTKTGWLQACFLSECRSTSTRT